MVLFLVMLVLASCSMAFTAFMILLDMRAEAKADLEDLNDEYRKICEESSV